MPTSLSKAACRSLFASSLLTATGCASFFGPYSPEAELEPMDSVQVERQTAEIPAVVQLSNLAGRPAVPSPEFDAPQFDAPVAEANPTVETAAAVNPFAVAPDDFETSTHRPEPPQENPFAAMEREREGVVQVSYAEPVSRPGLLPGSTSREAQPRLPQACDQVADCIVAASPAVQAYPDEYIFDGGDRELPVHYSDGDREGLDTEDTVAEFRDHNGENKVQPSNRVAIYAPRFGAVRTVSGPGIDVKVDKAAGATDIAGLGALHEHKHLSSGVHQAIASGMGTKTGASGVETLVPPQMAAKTDSYIQYSKVDQGMESRAASGANLLRTSDIQKLEVTIIGPEQANADTGFGLRASTSQATQTYSTFRVQAISGSENGGRPGKVHITKEAWPLVAKAGDVITFTIRFKNTGDENVTDVRIIDNLTPRLTYVPDSGKVTVGRGSGGDLSVVPNQEGSHMLIFELDEPLQGGETGTIVFNAKVL